MLRSLNPLSAALSVATLALAASACFVEATPAEGEGEGEGEGEATCTEPADVPCRDFLLGQLNMNPTDVAPGEIGSESDGAGTFEVDVDATAGVVPPSLSGPDGYVYARFTDEGLEKVALNDDASFGSMDWDIAFRRFVIRLNSGTSGPSCVTAARTASSTEFDALDAVPADLDFNAESFTTGSDLAAENGEPECDLVPDGSGLPGAPGVVLQNWWRYPGCVATTGNVYVLALANGRHVKFVVTQYYGSGQDTCNEEGTAGSDSGRIHLRYGFLD